MTFFPRSQSLIWYLFNAAGGSAILFGSFFITLRLIDAYNVSVAEEARRGVSVEIWLDAKLCQAKLVGGLQCGIPYQGRYTRATNTWLVKGRTDQSDQVASASYDNVSLRGVENAGTVALSRPFWQRAFSSESNPPP